MSPAGRAQRLRVLAAGREARLLTLRIGYRALLVGHEPLGEAGVWTVMATL